MRSRALWIALAVTAAFALVIAGAVGEHYMERAAKDPSSGSVAPAALVSNCGREKPVQRPTTLILTCDDPADTFLLHITWQYWGSSSALGLATLRETVCSPSCAEGHYADSPVEVVLDTPESTASRRQFSRLIVLGQSEQRRPQYLHLIPYPVGRRECLAQNAGCPRLSPLVEGTPTNQ